MRTLVSFEAARRWPFRQHMLFGDLYEGLHQLLRVSVRIDVVHNWFELPRPTACASHTMLAILS
ncbi:MAG TPA: hypothetical protein VN039_01790, partial [Nitrospira sp.]|nr:hypothetical protein [Nitrospira sp.]